MKIKRIKKEKFIDKFYRVYFFTTIIVAFFITYVFFNLSFWQNYKEEFFKRIYLNGISNYKYLPNIFGLVVKNSFSKIEDFNLEINQRNIIKIENNRKQKLNNSNESFVSAEGYINLNGEKIRTNIRLKGDRQVHYEDKEKSSYKLNLKKDFAYKGLTSFSIQKPRVRNYVHEWIFHKMAKQLNLISLDYEFVNFKLNGEDKGLFVIEEGFSNTLIEKNNRRAGPIFGLNEEFEASNFFSAKFDPYQLKYWTRSDNKDLFLIAKEKLTAFQSKNLDLNKIMDIKKWSDYFVLCDLLYTHHGLLPKSVKFYYNPISGLFEPIPFDGHKIPAYDYSPRIEKFFDNSSTFELAQKKNFYNDKQKFFSEWLKLFFFKRDGDINRIFYLSYKNSLNKITDIKFINTFFKKNKNLIDKINSKIYLDDFQFDYNTKRKKGLGIYYFDYNQIILRSKVLREKNKINLSHLVIEDYFDRIKILNKNYSNNSLIVKKILCNFNDGEITEFDVENKEFLVNFDESYIIKKDFKLINNVCSKITFIDKFTNSEHIKTIDKNLFTKKKNKLEKTLNKYFVQKQNKLYLKNKETLIDKNLYIPSGLKVIVGPNQTIRLINQAVIFSYSSWNFNGKKDKPILISGFKDNFGGGIYVSSKNKNNINHVNLQYLSGPEINKITKNSNNLASHRIYGALNFYKTSIEINNLNCLNISSEDALNIVNSDFSIINSKFSNISSDAIDFDFSNGKIQNIEFENILNDALDFSGSSATIKNIIANNVRDKAVSAGENSNLELEKLEVNNSFIGIANKDGSRLILKNSNFRNVKMPLAGYLKKNFYDKSVMNVENSNFANYKNKYILSKKATIVIDGKELSQNKKNKKILEMIYE